MQKKSSGLLSRPLRLCLLGAASGAAIGLLPAFTPPSKAILTHEFRDGFEEDSIVPPWNWHTQENGGYGRITMEKAHSGQKSYAAFTPVPDELPKAHVSYRSKNFHATKNACIDLQAWYWIPSGVDLHNLFLLDLESDVAEERPGPRLKLQDNDGMFVINNSKVYRDKEGTPFPQMEQMRVGAPTNRWFKVQWIVKLGYGNDGRQLLKVDEQIVIDQLGTTLPYSADESSSYNVIQFGITAYNGANTFTLYLDDISIRVFKECAAILTLGNS